MSSPASPPGVGPTGAAPRPRLEFRPAPLLITVSVVTLVLLRNHRTALLIYAGVVTLSLALAVAFGPRLLDRAERRFNRDALRLLAAADRAGLERLARRQRLLNRLGRRHLVTEMRALAALRLGDPAGAVALYQSAFAEAPARARPRVELNLAEAELAAGMVAAAEGRLRALIERQPDHGRARAALGLSLAQRGEAPEEAIRHLEVALAQADPRAVTALQAALDETRRQASALR